MTGLQFVDGYWYPHYGDLRHKPQEITARVMDEGAYVVIAWTPTQRLVLNAKRLRAILGETE